MFLLSSVVFQFQFQLMKFEFSSKKKQRIRFIQTAEQPTEALSEIIMRAYSRT